MRQRNYRLKQLLRKLKKLHHICLKSSTSKSYLFTLPSFNQIQEGNFNSYWFWKDYYYYYLMIVSLITKYTNLQALLYRSRIINSQRLFGYNISSSPQIKYTSYDRKNLNIFLNKSNLLFSSFSTNKNFKNEYEKSEEQLGGRASKDTIMESKIEISVKFIARLREYSKILSNSNKSGSDSSFLSGSQIQNKFLKQINSHFEEAGTTSREISESLENSAEKLQTMLKQNEKLYEMYKQKQSETLMIKYKTRHDQFLRLMQKLDTQYYREPNVTSVEPIQAALFLLDLENEMMSLIQLLYGAIEGATPYFKFTPDITNDDPFGKKFQYAWKKVKVIQLDPTTKATHDMVYNLLKKSLISVISAVINQHNWSTWNNQYWQKLMFSLSFPVSLVNLQKAELKCYKMWRKPTIQMSKNLLDLPEKGYIQHAKKIIFPSIKSNFFLYNHSAPKSTVENKQSVASGQVTAQQTDVNIFEKAQNSGRILLNYHQKIHFKSKRPKEKLAALKEFFHLQKKEKNEDSNEIKQVENVIVHIHGGGFISMSSELMQNHTRLWANQLQIPVFSLDYRKPPTHRFPLPLQDCIAGYKFIVENIHNYMNIRPKNIIIAGDSAGGNLACALQAYLMKEKYPILPKALLLMYPAVDLRIRYSVSRLHSFTDGIFSASFLMLCQKQYLGEDRNNQFDPLASPILLTEQYINPQTKGTSEGERWPSQWPKTIIMSGRKDPLFDDSIRLLERLARDKIDCKMLLYKDFSHGFMSMDQVLPGAKSAIQDSINELKQIIKGF